MIISRVELIINVNGPRECRELNSIYFANEFAKGNNPYALSLLEGNLPIATNMYGVFVPLIWSVSIRLFSFTGLSILQVCELVTVIVEIIGAAIICNIVYKKTNILWISLVASAFLYACFWRYTPFAGAFPDQYGVVLILCFLLLVSKCGIDNKKYNIFLYVCILVILFYVKQYFVLPAIGLLVYMLIKKRYKESIIYSVTGLFIGILSIIVVNEIFPLYFTEILPIAQGQTPFAGIKYSLNQIIRLVRSPFLIYTIALVYNLFVIRKKEILSDISLETVLFITSLPIVIYIACNDGTYYTYYLQLVFPYYIIMGSVALANIYKNIIEKDNIGVMQIIILCLFSIIMIKSTMYLNSYTVTKDTKYNKKSWVETNDYLDEICKTSKEYVQSMKNLGDDYIVVPHYLSSINMENNIYSYDFGQAEFNSQYNYDNWNNSNLWKKLFPHTGNIIQRNIDYSDSIIDKLSEGKILCIAVENGSDISEMLRKKEIDGYRLDYSATLDTGYQEWNTEIWINEALK